MSKTSTPKELKTEGTDNAAYQSDDIHVKKAAQKGVHREKKTDPKEDEQGRDPTMLSLFQKAVNRNAELKSKTMSEGSRRHTDRDHVQLSSSRSSSRDNLLQTTDGHKKKTKEIKEKRSKNVTMTTLQSEKIKHINGLSQMAGNLPPTYNKQRVVYFQNRFIVLDTSDRNVNSANSTINKLDNEGTISKINSGKLDTMETSFSKINNVTVTDSKNKRKDIDEDNSAMDARGIDIILTDPDNSSKQIKNMDSFNTEESKGKNSIWRKINRVLMDDRVKASNGQIVLENRHPEEYRILKKVLNILFLTVGITLFVSVIIVVIYAFIVGDEDNISVLKKTTFRPTSTTPTSTSPAVG